jgi:hypothetical protein
MAKMEIWKGKELVSTLWDVAPRVEEDEVRLTFLGPEPEKYIVRIPKTEVEDYYWALEEAVG